MSEQSDIGVIGLAVMGQNLVLNMVDQGWGVSVYNRTTQKMDEFVEANPSELLRGYKELKDFVLSLKSPRKILCMVKAGQAIDHLIEALIPMLNPGDILIDGGNTHFLDSQDRFEKISSMGLHYMGLGISGGEEGARKGPALMPGGSIETWEALKPILSSIAAKGYDGRPCCHWLGMGGAGHFVKMVHNGIEYGDMQLIAESYDLMRRGLGLSIEECQKVFSQWADGDLKSYLIEITSEILSFKDKEGDPLLDKILDAAGQKGTGRWTAINALDGGVNLSVITEAVFARILSSECELREKASQIFAQEVVPKENSELLEFLKNALYLSKIITYSQGFSMMKRVSEEEGWDLDMGMIAHTWSGGCIIKSQFLEYITKAYQRESQLEHLMFDEYFKDSALCFLKDLRKVLIEAIEKGVPVPGMSAALSYFDGLCSKRTPANLIQAQRDYFGAHTYERVDRDRGEFFHTDWIQSGGRVSSGTYNA